MLGTANDEKIRVFWIPGCSSCLRAKEFLEATGLPFDSVNVLETTGADEELKALNLTVPCVVVSDQGVPGLDLVGIAKLIGYDYDPPAIVEPYVLRAKYEAIITALIRMLNQLPDDALEAAQSVERDRDLRTLAGHATSIMRTFLFAYDNDVFDKRINEAPPREEIVTLERLTARARETKSLFDDWWDHIGFDDPLDRVIETYFGARTLQEILERQVWHTGHHVRQIFHFARELGVDPDWATMSEDLAGLPMPKRVTS